MSHPPDPESKRAARQGDPSWISNRQPKHLTPTTADIQARSLRQRLADRISLAVSLAALIWGAGPR
jgi:hypothetical protein